MIAADLLNILVCPETKQPVHLADQAVVDRANDRIEKGELLNVTGQKVLERVEALLVREDRSVAYLVREDIPVMLVDEGIPLNGLL